MILKKAAGYFLVTLIVLSTASCSPGKMDSTQAKACAVGYLDAVKSGDKTKALSFYSSQSDEAESPEKRMDKITRLEEVMGPVTGYELIDSAFVTIDDFPAMTLTYKVVHRKINSIEKFTILKEEGTYKINGHDIQSDN